MKVLLLSVHVVAAIVLVGPITVAASLFPRYARFGAAADPATAAAGRAVAEAMHRISRGYAVPALAVPVFGIGVAAALGVLGEMWVLVSMALTVAAGALLAAGIVPAQRHILDAVATAATDEHPSGSTVVGNRVLEQSRRLAMTTGGFALVWVVVVVLMILRPGSTTGV